MILQSVICDLLFLDIVAHPRHFGIISKYKLITIDYYKIHLV